MNDRGPYMGGRDLDLSQGAAEYLGLTRAGVDYVEYTYAGGGYDAGYETYPQDGTVLGHDGLFELLGPQSYASVTRAAGSTWCSPGTHSPGSPPSSGPRWMT